MNASHLTAEALGQLVARICDQRIRDHDQSRQTAKRLELPFVVRKFAGSGQRVIAGLASTADLDLQGDILEPDGARFEPRLPLLWMHSHSAPIGTVRSISATHRGIEVTAELVSGVALADEAWLLIQSGSLDSFSVGFSGLRGSPLSSGGTRWTEWRIHEVSIVSIGANPAARFKPKSLTGAIKLITPPRPGVKLIRG